MPKPSQETNPGRPFSIVSLILILVGFGIEIVGVVTDHSGLFLGGLFLFIAALVLFGISWWLRRKN